MRLFKKFKSLQTLNKLLIKQKNDNTDMILSLYMDNVIPNTDILSSIHERLDSAEQAILEYSYYIDEVLNTELLCVKKMIDVIADIVPDSVYNQYNDIVLIANLFFDGSLILDIIEPIPA